MKIIDAIILGLTQGLTEFLPVSSSGHLSLVGSMLGIEPNITVDLLLHFATLISVVVVLWKDIVATLKKPKQMLLLIIASIPACAVGVLCGGLIEQIFGTLWVLAITFLASSILLFISDILARKKRSLTSIGYKSSIIMGIGQAFAVLPGLSRSGTTIALGIMSGAKREEVVKFSFMMSIPIILGGMLVKIIELTTGVGTTVISTHDIVPLVIGSIFACISGYIAIRVMLNAVTKSNLRVYSIYLAILALFVFVNVFVTPLW